VDTIRIKSKGPGSVFVFIDSARILFLLFALASPSLATDTTNVFNNVVTNIANYRVDAVGVGDRRFDIWNSSRVTVTNSQTVGSNSFGSVRFNSSTNLPGFGFDVGLNPGSEGEVMLTAGSLLDVLDLSTNAPMVLGAAGSGKLTLSNSTAKVFGLVMGDTNGASAGVILVASTLLIKDDPEFSASDVAIAASEFTTGAMTLSQGSLLEAQTNSAVLVGVSGVGRLTASNSTVRTFRISVGDDAGGNGQMTLIASTNQVPSSPLDDGLVAVGSSISGENTGTVSIANGSVIENQGNSELQVGGLFGVGKLTSSNSTIQGLSVKVGVLFGGIGEISLVASTNLSTGSVIICNDSETTGTVTMTQHSLLVATNATHTGSIQVGPNDDFTTKPLLSVTNSTVLSDSILLGPQATFLLVGTNQVSGVITNRGAFQSLNGVHTLDGLVILAPSGTATVTSSQWRLGGVPTSLALQSNTTLSVPVNSIIQLAGHLTNNPTSSFSFPGRLRFNGDGSFDQMLDTRGADLGPSLLSYTTNFGVGILEVGTNAARLKLTGSATSAQYAGQALVGTGATLNLNGIPLYTSNTLNRGELWLNGSTLSVVTSFTNEGVLRVRGLGNTDPEVVGAVRGTTFNSGTMLVDGGRLTFTSNVLNNGVISLTNGSALVVGGALTGSGSIMSQPLTAAFAASPLVGSAPLTVTFSNLSIGVITNYFFNFGNGKTTNITSDIVTHMYTSAGTNTVTLIARGPSGSSTNVQVNLVIVTNLPPPVALFTGTPTNGAAPLTVTFTDTSTGTITNRNWSFGDGSTTNIVTAGIAHTYDLGGSYTVRLIAQGPTGVSTNTRTGYIVATNAIPVPNFTGSPTNGPAPLTVTFIDTSTGTITNRNWSFGDGSSTNITGTNIVHLYALGGTNTVRLIARGPAGVRTNTRNNYIIVTNVVPAASFVGSPTIGLNPLTVTFTDTSTGTITNRNWSFGDGSTTNVTGTNVVKTYTAAGTNTVRLIARGPSGVSTNTRNNYIVVTNYPVPVASFFGTPTNGPAPLTVTFTDTSTGVITSRLWDFGDGNFTPMFQTNFQWFYISAGTNTVRLAVTGPGGSHTNTRVNYIVATNVPPPIANFTASPRTGAAPLSVTFSDTSTGAINTRSWSFGDGSTTNTTATNLVYVYKQAGTNTVRLIVSSGYGISTNTKINYIRVTNAPPNASFVGAPRTGAVPLTVTFTDSSTGTLTNRNWSFGDGTTTNTMATNVVKTYTVAGTNTVRLIAQGPLGASTNNRNSYIRVTNIPPILAVSPSSRDFGSLTIGQSSNLSFQVVNAGQLTLSGIASVGSPFSISGGSPFSLPGGQTTTVTVAFSPLSAGSVASNVVFTSNGGGSTNAVSGIGLTPPQIGVSPSNLVFGIVATGVTQQASFLVTNLGQSTLFGTAAVSAAQFNVVAGTPYTVAGLGSTNLVIGFTPNDEGVFSNSVFFGSNGGALTNTVLGTGAIVPQAQFSANPTGGLAPLQVTFSDQSSGTITNRFWTFGDGATTNTTSTNVVHTYNLAGTNTVRLIVTGPVGVSTNTKTNAIVVTNLPPILTVEPSDLDYGALTLGDSDSQTFQVINRGELTLNGTAAVSSPFSITSGSPYSVAGGQTGLVTVSFSPLAAGTVSRTVAFVSNGGASSNTVIGTGLTPGQIGVSPVSQDYGPVVTGDTAQATFVITNTGGATVTNGSVSINGGPFTILSGTPFTVPGFGSTNVVIRFNPVTAEFFTNTVTFTTANGGNSTNFVTGQGAIVPVANFAANLTTGLAPFTVTFTDTSTGTITNRFWAFGDAAVTNTTATSVVHTYTLSGTNTVQLIVSGPVGADTRTRPNYIVVTNKPPNLVVSPSSRNFGSVTIGQSNTLAFSVINTGELTLTGTATVAGPFAIGEGTPYSVPGGQTTDVEISFLPVAAGTFSNKVIFTSNGGVSSNTVTGIGLTPAQLGVSPTSRNFGIVETGTTAQVAFVVTNLGGSVLTGSASALGGPFSILAGSPYTVAGFSSTNVTVSFNPPSEAGFTNSILFTSNGGSSTNAVFGQGAIRPSASFNGTPTAGSVPLTVNFNDTSSGTITNRSWTFGDGESTNTLATALDHTYNGPGSNTVQLIVRGPLGANTNTKPNYVVVTNIPPILFVTPLGQDFGSITIGQTNTLSFEVINLGQLTLTGSAAGGGPFVVTSGSPYTVTPGQTGIVELSFIPVTAGEFTNDIVFTSNGGNASPTVIGTGLTPAELSISPPMLEFGIISTGTTIQLSFVITNLGGSTLSGSASVGGAPYSIVSGSPFNVAGFDSANLTVQFAPAVSGTFTNRVIFTSNGGGSSNDVVGTGAVVPVASFSGSPTSGLAPLTVTFSDTSSGTITNRNWSFGDGSVTNITSTNVTYTYNATGTNTVRLIVSGLLGISTNTRNNYVIVTNIPPQLVITPSSNNFGSVTIGQTNSLLFQVSNPGQLTLTGTATVSSPFSIQSGSPYTVPGGATTDVSVSFIPSSAGSFSNRVVFASNGGLSSNLVTGVGLTPGQISVSPASLDFGIRATGTTAQASLVVTNLGGTAVSNGIVTVTGGPFVIASGSPFGLAGFGSTNVVISFTPPTANTFSNSAIITTANGGGATSPLLGAGAIIPVAAFTGTPTNGVAPLTVTFTDSSMGTITNRSWNFGDGESTNTTTTNLGHTFAFPGTNTVSLTVQGPVGSSTLTRTQYIAVVVYPPGDVNGDFRVTGGDSLLINQVQVGLRQATSSVFAAAGYQNGDVNRNGAVSGADSLLINQVVVGLRAYVVTRALPSTRTNASATPIIIYGIGFPTNAVPTVTIGAPVSLTVSNVVVVTREQITGILPAGGGAGTGTVSVVATTTNGVISFGRFVNP
jgi:PKD repeat protein